MSGEFAVAFGVVVLAGVVTGLTGFGFALVTVPPLLLIYDPKTVVAARLLLSMSGGWVPLLDCWRWVRVRTLLGLLPWACGGMVFGIMMLRQFPAAGIKLLASLVVIGFALSLLKNSGGHQEVHTESRLASAFAGLSSGTLATSTGLAGPPVIFLFTLRGYGVQAFRATIIGYFLMIDAIGLPALIASGTVGSTQLRVAGLLMPAAFGGRFVGMALVRHVSPPMFRRITLVLLVVTGAVGVANALVALR